MNRLVAPVVASVAIIMSACNPAARSDAATSASRPAPQPAAPAHSSGPLGDRIAVEARLLPGGPANVELEPVLVSALSQASQIFDIPDPVFVMLNIHCVTAGGRMDIREDAACAGGFTGNVTGRDARERVALVGLGAKGLLVMAMPLDFVDATPLGCATSRALTIGRLKLGAEGRLNAGFFPGLVRGRSGPTRGVWTVTDPSTRREATFFDADCSAGQ